jgi:hypothetical protein
MTTISREPSDFWLGVLKGSEKIRTDLSTNDPFEKQLWNAGYELGWAGKLKPNDDTPTVIAALVRKYDRGPNGLVWFAWGAVCAFVLTHWLT